MITKLLAFLLLSGSCFAQLSVTCLNGFSPTKPGPVPVVVATWIRNADLASGTFGNNSVSIAANLYQHLKAKSYFSGIVYFNPILGNNLATARVPLINTLGVGIGAIETGSGSADPTFSILGIQFSSTSRMIDLGMKTSALGSSNNGGFFYGENNFTTGGWCIGIYPSGGDNSEIYGINLTTAESPRGWYGNGGVAYASSGNGRWYLNRSSSTSSTLYLNGSSVATQTGSLATNNISLGGNIHFGGMQNGGAWYHALGRATFAGMTNGTLSSGDYADLDAVIVADLLTPTGR